MMYRKPSRRWVALKATYLLPLSALAVVAFARPQALSEIEEKVEAEVTKAVATVVESNDEPVIAEQEKPTVLPALVETRDTVQVLSDANLVNADLNESGHEVIEVPSAKSATELLDSTMLAVGARKIAEGTYIGHFQPNLNSDTVRIARATILDRKSQQTDEHLFAQNAADPYAYNITLNAETRKDRTGYYIRYLQPVNSTIRNYDKKEVDPKALSMDAVLVKNLDVKKFRPVAMERTKKETRFYFFLPISTKGGDAFVEKLLEESFANYAIHDMSTGDKYMYRSMDKSYFRLATIDKKDSMLVYQACIVFPPLDKKVDEVKLAPENWNLEQGISAFKLSDIPRKGRVITK